MHLRWDQSANSHIIKFKEFYMQAFIVILYVFSVYYTFFIDLYFHRHFSPHNLYVFYEISKMNVLLGNIDITLIAQLINVKVCTVSVWYADSAPSSTK